MGNPLTPYGPPAQPTPAALSGTPLPGVRFDASKGTIPEPDRYVSVDDQLQVALDSSSIGPFQLCVRILLPEGKIAIQREVINSAGLRQPEIFTFRLPEGFLLSVDFGMPTVIGPARGSVWCKLNLARTVSSGASLLIGLAQGYVTALGSVYWPQMNAEYPQRGPGASLEITVANPAAGADWTVSPPNNAFWVVQLVSAQLVTAIAAANRFPHLQFFDGAQLIWETPPLAAIPASLTTRLNWVAGGPRQAVTDNSMQLELPALVRLPSSFSIRTVTTALQAADQWQNIRIYTQEYVGPGG